jgi:GNAT superfamily N-acetyltransferase
LKRVVTTVHRATAQDAPAIQWLQKRWARENITHEFRPASLAAVRKALDGWCYVAETGGQTVGFVAGALQRSPGLAVVPKGARYLEIADLYVVRAWRSRGIGKRLLATLLAEAKRRRIRYVTLYSSTRDAHRVMRFYEGAGFRSWYVQMYRRLKV